VLLEKNLKKTQAELGGKDGFFVASDVDVDQVAPALADGAFYNAGQSCCSVERIYVHEKIYDKFVKKFVEEVKGFKIGDPTDTQTYLGPLTRQSQLNLLENQVKDAVGKGASLKTGGKRTSVNGKGYYFEPTVLTNVNHNMSLMVEDSFGPIIGIQSVKNDEEAIELINDSLYGLTSGIFTKDAERAKKILSQLNTGTVYLNCCDRVSPFLPWSGRRGSGVGVTMSKDGIKTFLQPKAWHWKETK